MKNAALGESRSRATTAVTNNQIDVLLLKQLSDADAVVTEITVNSTKLILASQPSAAEDLASRLFPFPFLFFPFHVGYRLMIGYRGKVNGMGVTVRVFFLSNSF